MAKTKFYVVWKGRRAGVFNTWDECSAQVTGYPGAEYKSFDSLPAADAALRGRFGDFKGKPFSSQGWLFAPTKPLLPSISVDAACSGAPGPVEYRGVETESGRQIFKLGPYADGTNNVGEFLAIVHAVTWQQEQGRDWPIYSDSENAILWVKAKTCRTKLAHTGRNARLFEMIKEAEETLKVLKTFRVLKWDTKAWGENPADFGRK
jgi:ribonuclease HI